MGAEQAPGGVHAYLGCTAQAIKDQKSSKILRIFSCKIVYLKIMMNPLGSNDVLFVSLLLSLWLFYAYVRQGFERDSAVHFQRFSKILSISPIPL